MATTRIKILFIAESATLAHVARPYLLATSLNPDEFEVHFAADEYYNFLFKNPSLKYHKIKSRSPFEFEKTLKQKGIIFDYQILNQYFKDELELFNKINPEIVVGDLRPSLAVSAPLSSIPCITITNAYWSPFAFKKGLPAMYSEKVQKFNWLQPLAANILKKEKQALNQALPFVFQAQASGIDQLRKEHQLYPFDDYLTGFTWGDMTFLFGQSGAGTGFAVTVVA